MEACKRVFLVDVDNTLIDSAKLKRTISQKFPSQQIFKRLYNKAKTQQGYFKIELIPPNFREYFLKAPFAKSLFPNALENIKKLKRLGRVIIFTLGDADYQKVKIQKSGIEGVVGKNNIIITQNKKADAKKLAAKFSGSGEVVFIDDTPEVLLSAGGKAITILVKNGESGGEFHRKVESFGEAVGYLEKFVSSIPLTGTSVKYSLMRGIDKNQIKELIRHSRTDPMIKKNTHDAARFAGQKSFASWRKKGKNVYTLIGYEGNLAGIIWFSKKKMEGYSHTFAVRTYPPVRGKGLALKFMKLAFKDFTKQIKHTGVWLKVHKDNKAARHLYKKFGFVAGAKPSAESLIMRLKYSSRTASSS